MAHDMKNVLEQLDFTSKVDYDFYKREPMHGAKVLKADMERLLDDVDWADKDQEIDTDHMQIELQAAFDNYCDLRTMKDFAYIVIVEPITEWATRPRRAS
jgi:hypothetical protein